MVSCTDVDCTDAVNWLISCHYECDLQRNLQAFHPYRPLSSVHSSWYYPELCSTNFLQAANVSLQNPSMNPDDHQRAANKKEQIF